jgi:hypothetical protein
MRNIIYIFILIILISCKNKKLTRIPEKHKSDSLLQKSIKLNDSSFYILKLADKKTEIIVQNTINKVNELEKNNNDLKNQVNNLKNLPVIVKTNTIIVRDTIYITEKKNFWGRKKVSVDSSSTETITSDTTINEN